MMEYRKIVNEMKEKEKNQVKEKLIDIYGYMAKNNYMELNMDFGNGISMLIQLDIPGELMNEEQNQN